MCRREKRLPAVPFLVDWKQSAKPGMHEWCDSWDRWNILAVSQSKPTNLQNKRAIALANFSFLPMDSWLLRGDNGVGKRPVARSKRVCWPQWVFFLPKVVSHVFGRKSLDAGQQTLFSGQGFEHFILGHVFFWFAALFPFVPVLQVLFQSLMWYAVTMGWFDVCICLLGSCRVLIQIAQDAWGQIVFKHELVLPVVVPHRFYSAGWFDIPQTSHARVLVFQYDLRSMQFWTACGYLEMIWFCFWY